MWCTTSSGNVKVKVEVDLLSLPTISLSHTRALLRLTPASWPQRVWGMGPGAWVWAGVLESAGDKGGGPLGYESVSRWWWWWWFSGVGSGLGAPSRRTTGTGEAQSQALGTGEFDREGLVEYWTAPPVHGLAGGPRVLMQVDAHRH